MDGLYWPPRSRCTRSESKRDVPVLSTRGPLLRNTRPEPSGWRTSAVHPKNTLPEVSSVRLKVERCGVGGGFWRKAMSSWNSGRIIGQKPPLKPKEVWAIRTRLQMLGAVRDLALFNLAIDSKLRACDLVAISVGDVSISGRVRDRAIIVQKKTGRPVSSRRRRPRP